MVLLDAAGHGAGGAWPPVCTAARSAIWSRLKTMSYCEHCEGQRFDRARVLRELRQLRRDLRAKGGRAACAAVELALKRVRAMELPHLELVDEGEQIVH